jgi:hypothetical protein
MLSRERIGASQWGQAERGVDTERPSGRRETTTFRKLPMARLGRKTTAANPTFTQTLSAPHPSA